MPSDNKAIQDHDVASARTLIQKALKDLGVPPESLTVSLMYVSSGVNQSIALKLQDHWSKILGIRIQLENIEFKQLHDRAKKSDFDIGIFAWLAYYNDPMNILERFQDKTSPRNYSKWTHERYNHLLHLAKQSPSPQVYAQMIQEAERFLMDEMPITGLYHDNYAFLIQPRVKGFAISPLGHIYFEKLWLE
jgi:ABC-type oligopeptide transport system substrate-binding subunit